jgi:hypothetical protein
MGNLAKIGKRRRFAGLFLFFFSLYFSLKMHEKIYLARLNLDTVYDYVEKLCQNAIKGSQTKINFSTIYSNL